MPTCLRGFVPKLHEALCDLALGIRMLDGNVFSANECERLNIEPGSHCLKKTDVAVAKRFVIAGMSKLEGSLPVCMCMCAHGTCVFCECVCVHGACVYVYAWGTWRMCLCVYLVHVFTCVHDECVYVCAWRMCVPVCMCVHGACVRVRAHGACVCMWTWCTSVYACTVLTLITTHTGESPNCGFAPVGALPGSSKFPWHIALVLAICVRTIQSGLYLAHTLTFTSPSVPPPQQSSRSQPSR